MGLKVGSRSRLKWLEDQWIEMSKNIKVLEVKLEWEHKLGNNLQKQIWELKR